MTGYRRVVLASRPAGAPTLNEHYGEFLREIGPLVANGVPQPNSRYLVPNPSSAKR